MWHCNIASALGKLLTYRDLVATGCCGSRTDYSRHRMPSDNIAPHKSALCVRCHSDFAGAGRFTATPIGSFRPLGLP